MVWHLLWGFAVSRWCVRTYDARRGASIDLSPLIPSTYVDKARSVGVEPTINHATGEPALAPYCVMAYSAPLLGFPHYHRNHASTPRYKNKEAGLASRPFANNTKG